MAHAIAIRREAEECTVDCGRRGNLEGSIRTSRAGGRSRSALLYSVGRPPPGQHVCRAFVAGRTHARRLGHPRQLARHPDRLRNRIALQTDAGCARRRRRADGHPARRRERTVDSCGRRTVGRGPRRVGAQQRARGAGKFSGRDRHRRRRRLACHVFRQGGHSGRSDCRRAASARSRRCAGPLRGVSARVRVQHRRRAARRPRRSGGAPWS